MELTTVIGSSLVLSFSLAVACGGSQAKASDPAAAAKLEAEAKVSRPDAEKAAFARQLGDILLSAGARRGCGHRGFHRAGCSCVADGRGHDISSLQSRRKRAGELCSPALRLMRDALT